MALGSDPTASAGNEPGQSGRRKLFVCGTDGQQKMGRIGVVEVAAEPDTGREKVITGGERGHASEVRG